MLLRVIVQVFVLCAFSSALLAGTAPARSASYETALITRMRMVSCAEPPRHGNFFADLVVGSAPATAIANAECPEYEIEGAKVFYRIRPRRDVLLPVGGEIRFRIHKRDLLVLTEDANKELVFSVVEMILKAKHAQQQLVAEQSRELRSRKCLTMDGEIVECAAK